MGDCYILCGWSGVASGSFLPQVVARRSYRRPLSLSGYGCRCPEAAQPPQLASGPRVSFAASGAEVGCAREPEDEEEDDRDSVCETKVVDKTF